MFTAGTDLVGYFDPGCDISSCVYLYLECQYLIRRTEPVLIFITSVSLLCMLIEYAAELHGTVDNGPSTGLMSKIHRRRTYRVVLIFLALLLIQWIAGSIIAIVGVGQYRSGVWIMGTYHNYRSELDGLRFSIPITCLLGAVVTALLGGITLGQGMSVGLDEPIHRRDGIVLSDGNTV